MNGMSVLRRSIPALAIEEGEATLVLSLFVVEALHGESQTRLDAGHAFDRRLRVVSPKPPAVDPLAETLAQLRVVPSRLRRRCRPRRRRTPRPRLPATLRASAHPYGFDLPGAEKEFVRAVRSLLADPAGEPGGVYVTLNPLDPILLARANNRLKEQGGRASAALPPTPTSRSAAGCSSTSTRSSWRASPRPIRRRPPRGP